MFLVAVASIAAVFLFAGTGRRTAGFSAADYRAKPLLTAWESRALAEIRLGLPAGFYACPQVRLADFLFIAEREPGRRWSALNRVASKSVDFAIIDASGRVALVVELDDKSHDRPDRRQRDQMVASVLARCNVPLLRVRPGQRVLVGERLAALRARVAA